jgi:hypothetical protein
LGDQFDRSWSLYNVDGLTGGRPLEVIALERFDILIPAEICGRLDALSQRMGIRREAVVLFSLVRYIEVQNGDDVPNPLALLLKGGVIS